jgi:hypothetical protein
LAAGPSTRVAFALHTGSFMRSNLKCSIFTTFAALTVAPLASAEPVVVAAPATDHADVAAEGDPNVDRAFLMPTAETQPAGSLSATDFELAIVNLTYGITDRVQIGGTAVLAIPFTNESLFLGNVKWQALRAGRWRWSLSLGGATAGGESHERGEPDVRRRFALSVGSALSYCLSADCHGMVSVSTFGISAANDPANAALAYGVSLTQRIGSEVKIVVEAVSGGGVGGLVSRDGIATAGLRFFGRHLAADLGVGALFSESGFATAFPLFSITGRI